MEEENSDTHMKSKEIESMLINNTASGPRCFYFHLSISNIKRDERLQVLMCFTKFLNKLI